MKKNLVLLLALFWAFFMVSSVYADSFIEYQSIATNGAADWESFYIGSDVYLAVTNSYNDSTHNLDSKIYKWNGTQFDEFQSIATNSAHDWEYFTIDSDTYLAVANYHDGSSFNIDSKIYKWDGTQFIEFQAIPSNGAWDLESFTIGSDVYLAVTNYHDGSSFNIDSKIYKWNGTQFIEFQAIPTIGAHDWKSFYIGSDVYLAVANFYNETTYNLDSKIYKWDGTQFIEFQAIATHGALDWESFNIGSDTYLAVANINDGTTYHINSIIYKWDGTQFIEFQAIPTNGAFDWDYFTIGSDSYLAVANFSIDLSIHNIDSIIYKWDGSQFTEFQAIATNGAYDWDAFTIDSDVYIAVANFSNNSTHNTNSIIYKFNIENPVITALTTTPDPATGDAPLTVDFEVTVTGGTLPYTYSWDFDGDGVEDSTDQNPSYTYNAAGTYTASITVTDANDNSVTETQTIEVLSDECIHSVYDSDTMILTIPYLDIPLLDPITQQESGEFAVFECKLKLVENSVGNFSVEELTYLEDQEADSTCHASYSYDGTMYIPNVDVTTVVVLPPDIIVQADTITYALTLKQLPISTSLFNLETAVLKE